MTTDYVDLVDLNRYSEQEWIVFGVVMVLVIVLIVRKLRKKHV